MAYGNVIADALAKMQQPLGPAPAAAATPPPLPAPGTNALYDANMADLYAAGHHPGSAQHQHTQKQAAFTRAAIEAFHHGKITREQLSEALADHNAYDFNLWMKEHVVHPTRAGMSHNMPPEEPHDVTPQPSLGVAAPPSLPSPRPPQ
jgi:hypothetical protein